MGDDAAGEIICAGEENAREDEKCTMFPEAAPLPSFSGD